MREQINALRTIMKEKGVDFYLIPTDDFHSSEYVGSYFKCRAWVSGFTGSAGTLLVSQNWAGLWTDGRYFIQAAAQLAGSGITLMKMGEPNVPDVPTYISRVLKKGMCLGFDGRCVNTNLYLRLKKCAEEKGASVNCELDLAGEIWTDRPALSAEPAFELEVKYAGRTRASKIADVREALKNAGADTLVLSTLMDICWLLNIRGGDIECTPVVLSYCAVTADQVLLFANKKVFPKQVLANLQADGVTICEYSAVYDYIRHLPAGSTVMMNQNVANSMLYAAIPEQVTLLNRKNPTELPKAVKNPVEVENFRKAHIKDGVAVTRFMKWVKEHVGKEEMTELSASDKLESFRREQEDYVGPSFSPIVSWGPHGAIVHYSATPETNIPVQPRSFLLCDTGGHYLQGTTDITRTLACGPLTEEEKKYYTIVLKSHLRLRNAHFRYGCSGANLDYIAREPLWELNMDYNHGTGHGVGYLLSVHEGPQGFRWKSAGKNESAVLEPGMVISDEPGLYLEGKFGIRHENLIVCVEGETNEYGRFLSFENLTMVPFDLDAVEVSLLEERDRKLLNAYHREVFEKISPYLDAEETEWLRHATRSI